MASKVRCRGCRDYFPKDQFWRPGFHAEECLRDHNAASNARAQKLAVRKNQPKAHPGKRRPTFTPELKQKVRERDDNRCRRCSKIGLGLHVHHVAYVSEGGPNAAWNLVALCLECHEWAHSDKKKNQPLIQTCLWLEYFHHTHLTILQTERWLDSLSHP